MGIIKIQKDTLMMVGYLNKCIGFVGWLEHRFFHIFEKHSVRIQ